VSKPWERYGKGPWQRYQGPSFDGVIDRLLGREGGYVNDPEDRGGETKYGISKAANPDVDIPSLTVDRAKQLYKERYWDAIQADSLPASMREIAFDAAVNQGVTWTKRALSQAAGDVSKFFELRANRYANIVAGDESQKKFARGWEKRLEEFAPQGPWAKYKTGE